MKCGWRVSGTAGGRWRRQRRTELDVLELSVANAPPGVTRRKSSQGLLQHFQGPILHNVWHCNTLPNDIRG